MGNTYHKCSLLTLYPYITYHNLRIYFIYIFEQKKNPPELKWSACFFAKEKKRKIFFSFSFPLMQAETVFHLFTLGI